MPQSVFVLVWLPMISKKDILKMVRHVRRKSQGVPDRRLIHPRREWIVGLALFVVVALAGVAYNMYTYATISNLENELAVEDSGVVRYQANTVDQALTIFRAKQAEFERLRTVVPPPPSNPPAEETPDETDDDSATDNPAPPPEEISQGDLSAPPPEAPPEASLSF